jgi:hypothetical protein
MAYRFFKCNVLGGFRLSDLNQGIKQGNYFYLDDHVSKTSRSVQAAIKARWMIEVEEIEASQFIDYPGKQVIKKQQEVEEINVSADCAKVCGSKTEKLESRQTAAANATPNHLRKQVAQKQTKEDKVAIPNFKEVEITTKQRQQDITTKGKDEVLKSPVEQKKEEFVKDLTLEISENDLVSFPNFDEKEKIKNEIKEEISKKISRKKRNLAVEEVN